MAVIPSRALSSDAVAVMAVPAIESVLKLPVEAEDAPIAVPSIAPALMSTVGIVAVPVNVGLAVLALELTAVAMLSNSVSISAPFTTFAGLPEIRLSFAVKFVVFVYAVM